MKDNAITRKMSNDRLHEWSKTNAPDEHPEPMLLDKASPAAVKKSRARKKKVWHIEWQWQNINMFKLYHHKAWKTGDFSDKWQAQLFGGKFVTLADAENSFKTLKPTQYFDRFSGRNWRIRNIETGEIILK